MANTFTVTKTTPAYDFTQNVEVLLMPGTILTIVTITDKSGVFKTTTGNEVSVNFDFSSNLKGVA
jgi:hypothetical protein